MYVSGNNFTMKTTLEICKIVVETAINFIL